MNKPDLELQITAILSECAARLMGVFRDHMMVSLAISDPIMRTNPAPEIVRTSQGGSVLGERQRRTPEQMQADAERVAAFVRKFPKGVRVGPIGKELGMTADRLLEPIKLAVSQGLIKRKGERRATTYYPGKA